MNPSRILIALLYLPATAVLAADPEPQKVPLWPNGAPGFEARRDEAELAKSYWVRNIHNPSITVFLPPKEKATGAAVLICPGGGHRELVFNAEGVEAARYLNSIGVAAFALKYRLGRERGSPYNVQKHAREDGVRAMRLVRSRAQEWGIDPGRVGIMGFSAGGEVAAMVAFGPNEGDEKAADPVDRLSSRPDFLVMIYSGPLGIPDVLPPKPPPAFLIVANDDRGASRVIASLFQKYRDARAPVEAHIFARGGHGFNMGKRSKLATLKSWPQRLADWMADNEILTPAKTTPAAKSSQTGPPARMTVTGRVLDPQGKPVPNASVMVYARLKQFERPVLAEPFGPVVTDPSRCDESGQFRIDAARTSTSRHDQLTIVALAPGYGVGWVDLDPDADPSTADIALRPEQVIRGRLFDVQGQPARGVALVVDSVSRVVHGQLDEPLFRADRFERFRTDLPAWPGPAVSDEDGRFTLRGLSRGLIVNVDVDDPRLTLGPTIIQTDDTADTPELGIRLPAIKVEPGPDPKPLTIALQPARTVTGRITYADTGKPVPNAPLRAGNTHFQADGEGRFRTTVPFGIMAQAPGEQSYLSVTRRFDWPKGMVLQSVDLALPRGLVIHGTVTEEGTGKPIAGAIVWFTPNQSARAISEKRGNPTPSATGFDGSFQVAATPGPGYLVVQGPSDDYVLREFGAEGGVFSAQPGSRRFYAHAYQFLDLKPERRNQEVNLTLRPGATVKGRVVGADGQLIRDAWIFSRVSLREVPTGGWKIWGVLNNRGRGHVRDGRFALHGLSPDAEVPAHFFEPKRQWGAVSRFSAKSASDGPVTVRLEPCGAARARLVRPDSQPVVQYRGAAYLISMVITPGPPLRGNETKAGTLAAEEASLPQIDPDHYGSDFASDAEGRLTFPTLIPGATYRIIDYTATGADGRRPAIRKEFTVKPGETVDLGDIRIEKPRS